MVAVKDSAGSGSKMPDSSASTVLVEVTENRRDDPSWIDELRRFLLAKRNEPVVRRPTPAEPRLELGICCSGGGIRSAAFCLGALQELDRDGELQRADVLAAVSGGSYIASAWAILRSDTPEDLLPPPYGTAADEPRPFAPDSPEEEHLRNRTNYLAPGLAGIWFLLWRVLRGLLLNLLILTSLLYVGSFLLGALVIRPLLLSPSNGCAEPRTCDYSAPGWAIWSLIALGGLALTAGLIDLMVRPREGIARFLESWSLRLVNLAILGAALVFGLAGVVAWIGRTQGDILVFDSVTQTLVSLATAWSSVILGVAAVLGVTGLGFGRKGRPAEESVVEASAVSTIDVPKGFWKKFGSLILRFVAALLGPLLTFGAVVAFAYVGTFRASRPAPLITLTIAFAIAVLAYGYGDLTRWSLHPVYKRRLSSAFVLRRAPTDQGTIATECPYGDPVSFSGLEDGPELVVCAAANVSDYGATPHGRHSVPFTFSRSQLYGGRLLGEMPMSEYERAAAAAFERDITVPAAVAMSGAAVSPSMGKHSRWWATFLLAMANVRLGVWLPNPRAVKRELDGGRSLRRRVGLGYLLRELTGRNSYRSDYVYVTDGGHYENLGLVELLRRGCRNIYCFDASGDAVDTFHTLGEAIAIAQSELNVEIEIDLQSMAPADEDESRFVRADHAVGKIWYERDRSDRDGEPAGVPGRLVVVKAGVTRKAPQDVLAYMHKDPRFPNHGTADQLYSVERFDAYRRLGAFASAKAIDAMRREGRGRGAPSPTVIDEELVEIEG